MRGSQSPAGPTSYVDVALWMLDIHDDLLDDDEDHPGADMDEETALEIIRREYVSGTCGAYAVALHDATGLPIVGLNGSMHVAVMTAEGDIVDYMGCSSLAAVAARYGMTDPPMTSWTREEAVDDVLMGEDETDDPWEAIAVARWVLTKRGAPQTDFMKDA